MLESLDPAWPSHIGIECGRASWERTTLISVREICCPRSQDKSVRHQTNLVSIPNCPRLQLPFHRRSSDVCQTLGQTHLKRLKWSSWDSPFGHWSSTPNPLVSLATLAAVRLRPVEVDHEIPKDSRELSWQLSGKVSYGWLDLDV